MITRRGFVKGVTAFAGATCGLSGYALAVEPMSLGVTRYRVTPPAWPSGLALRIAVLADIHACEPWMSADRVAAIALQTNALNPDMVLLLGDYAASHRFVMKQVPEDAWAEALKVCRAPLGVHAVLGNHDWWDDKAAQRDGKGPVRGRLALEKAGIPVYENDVVRLVKDGRPFWLAGLGDQLALLGSRGRYHKRVGVDDLTGTLAKVKDDAPVIMMAHEPDIFVRVPDRVSLTISGHTHGGQVRMLGYAPMVPSRYRNRFAYGHVVEQKRHLLVSGGLGCSVAPIRFGIPPEIVLVEVGQAAAVS